ncbi:hypothetical protein CSUI_007264, partial [Cystoisospora suis]
ISFFQNLLECSFLFSSFHLFRCMYTPATVCRQSPFPRRAPCGFSIVPLSICIKKERVKLSRDEIFQTERVILSSSCLFSPLTRPP